MVKPQGQRRPDAKKAKNTSVAKRIRDVKRLLSKVRPYTLCVSRLGTLVHLTYAQPTSVLQGTIDTKMRQSLEKKLALLEQESVENKTRLREQKYAVRYVSPRDGRASCWCPEVEGLPLDVELRPGGHSVVFAPPFLTSVHSSCRYHKVRFFERIKLERRIHKLEKALKQGVNVEETRKKLSSAREDLEYVLHFPKGEKFVSLLKDAEDAEAQAHLERERARLRALVKQQLRDDAIVNELHEGRVQESDDEDAPEGTAGDGFAQELQEDDFFANPSDEERGSSDEDIHSIDDRGSEERGSEERGSEERGSEERGSDEEGYGVQVDAAARAEVDSDQELLFDDTPEAVDTSDEMDAAHTSDRDDASDEPGAGEQTGRAYRKQPPPPRVGNPKATQAPRGRKDGQRGFAGKEKRNSMGKRAKGKTPKKGQPLRTRAEGGRKRRSKKK